MKKQINKKNSFTLIEILVSVAIFLIIIVVISGIFVSSVRTQKRCLVNQELLNQTSYALEYMSRALRIAKKDDIGGSINCLSDPPLKVNYEITGRGGIKFRNYNDDCQEFFLGNDFILYEDKNGNVLPLTSSKFKVNLFSIQLVGEEQQGTDDLQPKITLLLEIEAVKGDSPPKLKIQTTISQRNLDIAE